MNWKLVLVGVIVAVLLWLAGTGVKEEPQLALTILHTNDVHAHYEPFATGGGVARLATVVDEVRQSVPHSLLLDAGDQFQGSLVFTVGGPEVVARVMNAVGYDAMVIGNHEFDLGPTALASFLAEVEFPVVSANIDATHDAALDGDIRPFDVFLVGGEIVAVFGLTTESTSTASSPGRDIVFEPAARRARSIVEMLERQGVNRIVALTHLGYDQDLALAASVAGIDVIVGGHSHTTLGGPDEPAYPTWVTSPAGEPVAVVTDGEWGQSLGRLDVVFDSAGRVAGATGTPIPVRSDLAQDPEVAAVLAPYAERAQQLVGEPLGASETDLDGERTRVRSEETNLGDAIAEAMLAKAAALGARVAIMNGGGIRASIPQGPITLGQILEVLPFGNEITVVTVTAADLKAALESGVSQVESGAGRFPQVAGLRFSFDPAAPVGERIRSVDVWDDATKTYRALGASVAVVVATNDFLAGGGDGYAALAEGEERYDTGWLVSDAFADYVRGNSPLRVEKDGRIQRSGA